MADDPTSHEAAKTRGSDRKSLSPMRIVAALIKVGCGLSLLWLLFSRVNIGALGQALEGASPTAILLGCAGLIVAVSVNAVRWRIIVGQLGGSLSTRLAIMATFEGMFFNLFLPTGVGGDTARAYRAYDRGVPLGVAVTSGLADRAVGFVAVMGLILIGSFATTDFQAVPSFWLVTLFSVAGLVAAVGLAGAGRLLARRQLWAPLQFAISALDAFATVIFSARFITQILPLTIVANLANCAALWACAQAIGLRVSYADAVVVLEASSLAAILPVSFGGWGVREGATVALLSALNNSVTGSVAASLIYAGVLVVIGCIGAAVWVANPYRHGFRAISFRRSRRPVAAPSTDPVPDKATPSVAL